MLVFATLLAAAYTLHLRSVVRACVLYSRERMRFPEKVKPTPLTKATTLNSLNGVKKYIKFLP